MANLQVKNVPEALHEELRRRAKLQHVTVRDYVLALIRKDQETLTVEEWLDSLPSPAPGAQDSVNAADLIREGRRERAAELGIDYDDPLDPDAV